MTLTADPPGVDDAGLPSVVRWQEDVDSTTDHSPPAPAVGWTCTWETGPDAGGIVAVGGERMLVGRAGGAGVRCDDAALEPHHALLVPDGDELRLVQLTGRTPITVGGQPIDGGVVLELPALVEMGHSTLRIRHEPIVARPAAHVRDGVVLRTPRAVPEWAPRPLAPPGDEAADHGRPGGLVPALVGIAAAGVLALVLHQPMFLVFGALGGVVALASWLSQRAGFVRRRRRSRRELDRDRAALETASAELAARYVAHLAEHTSTAASAMATITSRDERLWSRRADHRDAFTVSFGVGDLAWRPPIEGGDRNSPMVHVAGHADGPVDAFRTTWLHDQPVTLDLAPGARLAIRGGPAHTAAVARAVLLQLAANCGPADVRLLVVTDRPDVWAWFAALPHAASPDGSPLLATPTDVGDRIAALDLVGGPPLVVTTDIPELLASRTSVLRRLVGATESPRRPGGARRRRAGHAGRVHRRADLPDHGTSEHAGPCPVDRRPDIEHLAVGGARRRHRSRRCGTRRRCTARAGRPGRSVRRVEPAARARLARRPARGVGAADRHRHRRALAPRRIRSPAHADRRRGRRDRRPRSRP